MACWPAALVDMSPRRIASGSRFDAIHAFKTARSMLDPLESEGTPPTEAWPPPVVGTVQVHEPLPPKPGRKHTPDGVTVMSASAVPGKASIAATAATDLPAPSMPMPRRLRPTPSTEKARRNTAINRRRNDLVSPAPLTQFPAKNEPARGPESFKMRMSSIHICCAVVIPREVGRSGNTTRKGMSAEAAIPLTSRSSVAQFCFLTTPRVQKYSRPELITCH
jgi:predicted component of type VI protein secretion system